MPSRLDTNNDVPVYELALRVRRRLRSQHLVLDSASAERLLRPMFRSHLLVQETVKILLLDTAGRVRGVYDHSRGGLTQSPVDCRLIFAAVLLSASTRIIVAHNHPSGDPTPSRSDIKATRHLKDCCSILDIELSDHIILGDPGYFSFADNHLL